MSHCILFSLFKLLGVCIGLVVVTTPLHFEVLFSLAHRSVHISKIVVTDIFSFEKCM
uniref:Uncharacterized protein n=1 Tax=Arundo donax TaxID=35708 RepID=A0A0A9A1E2_ARUDO